MGIVKLKVACLLSSYHQIDQGRGIGKLIIETLENDYYFKRAQRIEIPASVTAVEFYRKYGYDFKNGIKFQDDEGIYRMEKFK
ncbi:GNAT family N-acetyltransferase [Mammaliicoccus sciuri]